MRPRDVTSVTGRDGGDVPPGGEVAPPPAGRARLVRGQTVDLVAGEAAHGGWCVARLPGGDGDGPGPVVFVRHALPGERVRARITETTSRFARADAVEIVAASPDRVEPPCPYARPGGCGGCDWQHASLPAQRELKASVLRQQLNRIAGLDWPVTVRALPGDEAGAAEPAGSAAAGGAGPGLGWRTRVKFAVRDDGVAGLRAHRSHEVVAVDDCLIAHRGIRDLGVTRRPWPRATSVEAAVATGSGERAVIASGRVSPADLKGVTAETVIAAGSRRGPGGGRATVVRGRSHLRQRAAGRSWRVSAAGFWQVHPSAADTLARVVLEALRPEPGDTALDLYCGAGLFAGVLAEAVGPGGAVIWVEASSPAVRDARRNLRDVPWATVYQGDATEVIARGALPAARLAVLDPPRTGVAREVIEFLAGGDGTAGAAGGQRRVAYVSCDPATLARDIALFIRTGWRLEDLRAFDAFPMTHHMECVATLVSGRGA